MHSQTTPQKDPSTVVMPPIQPTMHWRLAAVEPLSDWCLHVRFLDGTEGRVDMASLVHAPDAGVFAVLADPALFARVTLEYGAVTWPGEIDLAPDAMYAAIRQSGVWVL